MGGFLGRGGLTVVEFGGGEDPFVEEDCARGECDPGSASPSVYSSCIAFLPLQLTRCRRPGAMKPLAARVFRCRG